MTELPTFEICGLCYALILSTYIKEHSEWHQSVDHGEFDA